MKKLTDKERKAEYQRNWRKRNPDKARESSRRWYQNNKDRYRKYAATAKEKVVRKVEALLGSKCVCCGSQENLTIDHIKPEVTKRGRKTPHYDVVKHPEKYQMLCYSCNRFKSIGPACPCKWWDSIDPSWRELDSKASPVPYKYEQQPPDNS
jgi:hypothetical protein